MTSSEPTTLLEHNSINSSVGQNEIDLNKHGVTLYKGYLFNHDYLWFSSSEISRISTTIPVVHNYALTYAISYYSYAKYDTGAPPQYEEDLKQMLCYATPAMSIGSIKETILYNAIDDLRLTTGKKEKKHNSPNFGRKTVVIPNWSTEAKKDNLQAFKFYLFCFEGFVPPSVVRIGKKGASARIFWEEIETPVAKNTDGEIKPSHPINPLDVSGEIISGIIVKIPPHSFYRVARIKNDWIIQKGRDVIHLPKRILSRL